MADEFEFNLGKLVATPGALERLNRLKLQAVIYVSRHVKGDFGDISEEDAEENRRAIQEGVGRVLSAYQLTLEDQDQKIWIITDFVGSAYSAENITTVLRPEDY